MPTHSRPSRQACEPLQPSLATERSSRRRRRSSCVKSGMGGVAAACLLAWTLPPSAARAGGDPDLPDEKPAESSKVAAGELLVEATPAAAAPAGSGLSPTNRERQIVGAFSSAGGQLPQEWEPLEFEKIPAHTRYSFVEEEGRWVVRADANASASGFTRRVDLDLKRYPILRWRWKVGGVLERGDVSQKSGDDYPARIYIAFKYEPDRVGFFKKAKYTAARAILGDLPIGAINYIWASNAPQDGIYDNPFAGSFVKMIAVESGRTRVGEWIEEERDVYSDYVRAFGEDPPRVEGVALMTDTDNTGESATAFYGDIEFLSREAP